MCGRGEEKRKREEEKQTQPKATLIERGGASNTKPATSQISRRIKTFMLGDHVAGGEKKDFQKGTAGLICGLMSCGAGREWDGEVGKGGVVADIPLSMKGRKARPWKKGIRSSKPPSPLKWVWEACRHLTKGSRIHNDINLIERGGEKRSSKSKKEHVQRNCLR